jgi:hypothetical protein
MRDQSDFGSNRERVGTQLIPLIPFWWEPELPASRDFLQRARRGSCLSVRSLSRPKDETASELEGAIVIVAKDQLR